MTGEKKWGVLTCVCPRVYLVWNVVWSRSAAEEERENEGGGGRGGGRSSSLQAVLYIINYVLLCVQWSVHEGPGSALLCIPTALCKWLAGGNDFREKVILRPMVHINDSFIHSQVYNSRWGKGWLRWGRHPWREAGKELSQLPTQTDISRNDLQTAAAN